MQEVLTKIKPSKQEQTQFQSKANEVLTLLNKHLQDATAILGGSGEKDTWLSGNYDVDIFVAYNYTKYKDQSAQLSKHLQKTLKLAFPKIKFECVHGSRDYFQFTYKDLSFEIVPILKIKTADDAINITDVSPLHAQWVNKNAQHLKDDIRLAKQFCKANNLYGAESYIQGFSGYILEILTIYYGSFEKLLQASLKWKFPQIVDPAKYYKAKMALFHLNQSKLQSPLIIVDPVDKNRNAAAALGTEKCKQFQKLAKEYLKHQSDEYFTKKIISKKTLQTLATQKKQYLVYLDVTPTQGKKDVVGAKLLKTFNHLKKELKPFTIQSSGWQWEGELAQFYFITKTNELAEFEIRAGPPTNLTQAVANFKKKNKNTFTKEGKLYAKIKRPHTDIQSFTQNLLQNAYVKERIKKAKLFSH